jgi:hypothetical protein
LLSDSLYHKLGKKNTGGFPIARQNGWLHVNAQYFQERIKKFIAKERAAKLVIVKKPEKKKKAANVGDVGKEDPNAE